MATAVPAIHRIIECSFSSHYISFATRIRLMICVRAICSDYFSYFYYYYLVVHLYLASSPILFKSECLHSAPLLLPFSATPIIPAAASSIPPSSIARAIQVAASFLLLFVVFASHWSFSWKLPETWPGTPDSSSVSPTLRSSFIEPVVVVFWSALLVRVSWGTRRFGPESLAPSAWRWSTDYQKTTELIERMEFGFSGGSWESSSRSTQMVAAAYAFHQSLF